MKTKHTPQDWKIQVTETGITYIFSDSLDGKNRPTNICCVHTLEDGVNNKERLKESKANAKLIAAAPDLLDNLLRCVDRFEENAFGHMSAVKRAKEAIKKATE